MKPSENCEGRSTSRASRMSPAHVPKMGLPVAWNFSSAGTNSQVSSSFSNVVLSPPGMINPSTCSSWPGMRTSSDGTPMRSSACLASAKSPWSASKPIVMSPSRRGKGLPLRDLPFFAAKSVLPPARLEQVGFLQLGRLDAGHRLAKLLGYPREDVGILVVRGGLDDGARAYRGVRGLEDARAHEHGFRAELHHQRGVGRRGDTAR